MAIIDTDYVDNAIGADVRAQVAPTTPIFDQYEEQARVTVQAAAQVAGYTIADDSANATVKLLVLGQWVLLAYQLQKGLDVPPAIRTYLNWLELIRSGDMPIPGLTPSSRDGIGGTKWSSRVGANGRTRVFDPRDGLKSF